MIFYRFTQARVAGFGKKPPSENEEGECGALPRRRYARRTGTKAEVKRRRKRSTTERGGREAGWMENRSRNTDPELLQTDFFFGVTFDQ